MVEEVDLDGLADNMSCPKWEATIEESFDKEALVKKLRQLIEEHEIVKRKLSRETYTYLDAISRQGCYAGVSSTQP